MMDYNSYAKSGNGRSSSVYISSKVARWLYRLLESGIEMDDDGRNKRTQGFKR